MDYNFFEPVRRKPKKTDTITLGLVFISAIALGSILILLGFEYISSISLDSQARDIEQKRKENGVKIIEYNAAQAKLETLRAKHDFLKDVYLLSKWNDVGNIQLYVDLLAREDLLPENVALTNINIDQTKVSIKGIAKDAKDITTYENNLRYSGHFTQEINVPAITYKESGGAFLCDFSMDLTLREQVIPIPGMPQATQDQG